MTEKIRRKRDEKKEKKEFIKGIIIALPEVAGELIDTAMEPSKILDKVIIDLKALKTTRDYKSMNMQEKRRYLKEIIKAMKPIYHFMAENCAEIPYRKKKAISNALKKLVNGIEPINIQDVGSILEETGHPDFAINFLSKYTNPSFDSFDCLAQYYYEIVDKWLNENDRRIQGDINEDGDLIYEKFSDESDEEIYVVVATGKVVNGEFISFPSENVDSERKSKIEAARTKKRKEEADRRSCVYPWEEILEISTSRERTLGEGHGEDEENVVE